MAKPTKLTKEMLTRICALIRAGNYVETAAATVGIRRSTLHEWLRQGRLEAGDPAHIELADAVEQAAAEAEARDVAIIAKAAQTQWQAAAWRLERKNYARWGKKERHEVSGPRGGPVETTARVVVLPPLGADDDKPLD